MNIPEQTVQSGLIRLQVIESKIGKVKITGNRWTTGEKIMRDLPSLAPGEIIYVPDVQKDLEQANRGQDFKASPVLSPGEELGTTDVEIKVQDQLPLHGNLEINDRATLHTDDLRLNAMLRYDNLWQMDHSVSAQFQTSPQDAGEVKMYALSYTLPAPWTEDQQIAVYGVKSDSNTTVFGQGLLINGKGSILGLRYVMPLAPYETYAHNITMGFDYKDFRDSTGFLTGAAGFTTPIKYAPLTLSYNSSLGDGWGVTQVQLRPQYGLTPAFLERLHISGGAVRCPGGLLYLTAGVERNQSPPRGHGSLPQTGRADCRPASHLSRAVCRRRHDEREGVPGGSGPGRRCAPRDRGGLRARHRAPPACGRPHPVHPLYSFTITHGWRQKSPSPPRRTWPALKGRARDCGGLSGKTITTSSTSPFLSPIRASWNNTSSSVYFKLGVNF